MSSGYTPTVGETCSVVIPVHAGIDADTYADEQAASALYKVCREHGMSATDIHRTSVEPWTERLSGLDVDPLPDFMIYRYEATAAAEPANT